MADIEVPTGFNDEDIVDAIADQKIRRGDGVVYSDLARKHVRLATPSIDHGAEGVALADAEKDAEVRVYKRLWPYKLIVNPEDVHPIE